MTSNANTETNQEEQLNKVISALFHRTIELLKIEFPEYKMTGHVRQHHLLGPFLAFELENENSNAIYSCGFMLNELFERHKDPSDAKQWLASFYIDMINEHASKPLPLEPKNDEEAKALVHDTVLPHCLKSIREEFGETAAQVKITQHPKAGAILETMFPNITTGKNICAVPINLLLALHLLNRDCAEPIINGLYKIREDAGIA